MTAHLKRLQNWYNKDSMNVVVLGIPDEYDRFSPELVAECERIFKDGRYL